MSKLFFKCISWYLVFAMLLVGIAPNVYAGFSPSDQLVLSRSDRTYDLQRIQMILETKLVRTRLNEFGFSQDEIQTRLSRLDSEQIHQLALKLDDINVGAGGFEVLVVVLLIAIVVGIWFQITGKRVIIQSR